MILDFAICNFPSFWVRKRGAPAQRRILLLTVFLFSLFSLSATSIRTVHPPVGFQPSSSFLRPPGLFLSCNLSLLLELKRDLSRTASPRYIIFDCRKSTIANHQPLLDTKNYLNCYSTCPSSSTLLLSTFASYFCYQLLPINFLLASGLYFHSSHCYLPTHKLAPSRTLLCTSRPFRYSRSVTNTNFLLKKPSLFLCSIKFCYFFRRIFHAASSPESQSHAFPLYFWRRLWFSLQQPQSQHYHFQSH